MKFEQTMPLEGIKVLELATVVAAPTVGRMFAAYGAEVIKVENLHGDDLRSAGKSMQVVSEDYKNPIFTNQNSGKLLTAINLKSEEGKEAVMKLISETDVLISNIRPAALERLGLDYESLKEKFPSLIYAHLSGFGPTGPVSHNPGFDITAFWLRGGSLSDWKTEEAFPFNPTYAFGDMATSSVLLSGVLMALLARERTGHGTFVNTSLYASGIWCNSAAIVSRQEQFEGDYKFDPLRPADPFSHVYLCADKRYIGFYDNDYEREVPKFANTLGIPEIIDDPRYKSLVSLRETDTNFEAAAKVAAVMKTKTADEWRSIFVENSISCEILRTIGEVSSDEQAIVNGYVKEVTFKDDMKVMMPSPPIHFSDYAVKDCEVSGKIGEDTDKVFSNLDYSVEEIENMRQNGIIK